MARRGWGSLKTQRSGRIQASYVNPQDGVRYYALQTYDNKMDAEAWLAGEKRLIEMETWTPPQDRAKKAAASAITLEEYTRKWLVERDLADGTRDLYSGHAERRIYPVLGEVAVTEMTPALVRAWWAGMGRKHPTARRHAYNVLRAVMNTAVEDKLIAENPCRIEQKAADERDVEALTPEELDIVAAEIFEHYRIAAYILAWTSLRFGELIELRRKDIVDDGMTMKLRVRRGASRVGNKIVVGNAKTVRSKRPVTVPPHVAEMIRAHMKDRTKMNKGPEAFLVTTTQGNRLSKSAFTKSLKRGYAKIGRPELRIHDLRAVGATFAAQAGATTKELMARLGHTTPRMAMKYQMASEARDEAIAEAMSKLAKTS
ncbi:MULTISPECIES: tyrosine-type recombinase/integrase [Mycobacteriaceae]|uniref:Integrase n=1 Tax=Mycobacterium phage L5 TaxID=31757 RepID=VINT_BPML5|nr:MULTISPECIES: site-specific integrase [Mycobacteriaceae]NP_039697.1 site-specific integrase [Fromanvirus L5]P22884.2 RecName: Full=Integrase; AltName: Full=Int-L5; AltName: Full=L5 Int [Fromanvirus L5]AGB57323.1 integrase [Cloning vector pDRIA]AGB57328.1 integrase [Cloning vector pDRIB]AGB57341.1 integrase [Cloning vector pIRIA]AGB57346.1 integrase [Cloning vector pIRIB]AHK23748.1 integrase [Integrative vector pTYGi9]AWN08193.1 L5 integrase [Cloning vector pAP151]AWN08196.1 L5 integrase